MKDNRILIEIIHKLGRDVKIDNKIKETAFKAVSFILLSIFVLRYYFIKTSTRSHFIGIQKLFHQAPEPFHRNSEAIPPEHQSRFIGIQKSCHRNTEAIP